MITWSALPTAGAGSLVTLAVVMIFTGRWIPRSVMRDWVSRNTYDEMRQDRDLWRTLALENRTQFHEVLLPTAQAARKTFAAVDRIAAHETTDGQHDEAAEDRRDH